MRGDTHEAVGDRDRGAVDGFAQHSLRAPTLPLGVSLGAHALAVAGVLVAPLLRPPTLPPEADYLKVLVYDPPPPPPPLPQRGSPQSRAGEVAPQPAPTPIPLLESSPLPERLEDAAGDGAPKLEPPGVEDGSPDGLPEGLPGGHELGVPGGVFNGVPGGVPLGTGRYPVPVRDYDRGPVPIRRVAPQYPAEAFRGHVEGEVVVEVLIDSKGHVVRAELLTSVPLLDDAALACAKQWLFSPAIKNGRPVPSLALVPVRFRIF
jgi:protein TonB